MSFARVKSFTMDGTPAVEKAALYAAWAKVEPLLPRGRRGAHRVDDRRVISGIIHMLRVGARWRDCPAGYGPYTTIYNRVSPLESAGRLVRHL
jgi:transposase